jgi:hypothetical protein
MPYVVRIMLEAKMTADGAVLFSVRLTPRSRSDSIEGVVAGALRVRVMAPAVDDRANEALRRFLADCLNISPSAVKILAGARSRMKRVAVRGTNLDRVLALAPE